MSWLPSGQRVQIRRSPLRAIYSQSKGADKSGIRDLRPSSYPPGGLDGMEQEEMANEANKPPSLRF